MTIEAPAVSALTEPCDVSAIVDALGGPAEFGKICGFSANPAQRGSDMRRRNSIPVGYWPAVIEAAKERGLKLNEAALTRIHTKPDLAVVGHGAAS